MDMTIAILLWLGSVVPYGTYSQQQIDDKIFVNSAAISAVMANPTQQASIWNAYGTLVPTVVIEDVDEVTKGVIELRQPTAFERQSIVHVVSAAHYHYGNKELMVVRE